MQDLTQAGAILGYDFEGLGEAMGELGGELPDTVPVAVTRILRALGV